MRFQQGEGRTGGDGERALAMLRAQICRHDAVQLTLHATTHAIAGVHPIMTVTMTVMVMVMMHRRRGSARELRRHPACRDRSGVARRPDQDLVRPPLLPTPPG